MIISDLLVQSVVEYLNENIPQEEVQDQTESYSQQVSLDVLVTASCCAFAIEDMCIDLVLIPYIQHI